MFPEGVALLLGDALAVGVVLDVGPGGAALGCVAPGAGRANPLIGLASGSFGQAAELAQPPVHPCFKAEALYISIHLGTWTLQLEAH